MTSLTNACTLGESTQTDPRAAISAPHVGHGLRRVLAMAAPKKDPALEGRIDALDALAHQVHGYVHEDGEKNPEAVEDMVFEVVSQAVCEKRGERRNVVVTRSALMERVFPNVPGPGEWDEQDDPEASEGLYRRLDTLLWRFCDSNAGSRIQSRLAKNGGHILCRTQATVERNVWGVYVTKDWQCLAADFTGPDKQRIHNAVTKMGRNVEMAADRVPEHAKKLQTELTSGVKVALEVGVAPIRALIEAASLADDDSGES